MNKFIDHTLLRPDATKNDISRLCEEANQYKFASVCVAPCWADFIKLINPNINLCIVRNFPHGNHNDIHKSMFANEIDYVINIGFIKSKWWTRVEDDIVTMHKYSLNKQKEKSTVIKVIVEVGYLTDEELFTVSDLLIKHKIDFIKTCTGYGPRGVSVEDIVKIKKHVGDKIKIKASGGIKTAEFAKQLIEAGADRIGTSSGVSIIKEINK